MDTLLHDVRYALRQLARTPGFAAIAVVTLALGIGANAAIFSVVNRLLFDPLPFLDTRPLVAVWETAPRGTNDRNEVTPGTFRDVRAGTRSLSHVVAHAWWVANVTGGDRPERLQGFRVSPDYFDALGVRPLLGRTFREGEDQPGSDGVVILSHSLWARRYAADSGIVGRTLSINGIPRVVIGVMPEGVRYPAPAQLWAPLSFSPEFWQNRTAHFLLVTGRLADGATLDEARAELRAVATRLATAYPATNTGAGLTAHELTGDATRMLAPMLRGLFVAVGFVLLIACANVANLLLARGSGRRRELAVRTALGAARGRLVRQLLTESVVLAVLGGTLGVLVGMWGTGVLVSLVPPEHQRFILGFDQVRTDGAVLAFTALTSLAAALLFGLLPALRASRADLGESLKDGSPGAGRRHRLRGALIGAEVALALVLLVGAGLTLRSFAHVVAVSPGFDERGVATAALSLPGRTYDTEAKQVAFYRALDDRLAALPGVTAAGAANVVPLCQCNQTTSFDIAGAPRFPPDERPDVGFRVVTPGYFAALRIPLREGRLLERGDDAAAPRVMVVNDVFARRWFPGGALGRRVTVFDTLTPIEIVGVVGDVRHNGLAREVQAELYLPHAQAPAQEMVVLARTAGDPSLLFGAIRAEVAALDADLPLADERTMSDVVRLALGPFRFALTLLSGLGGIALVLAGVGIFGVVAHLVGERTREIGIRIALGGSPGSVRALVLRQGLRPVVIGLAAGGAGAFAINAMLANRLPGITGPAPLPLAGAAVLLLLAAVVACLVPARRAVRVDPMVALRTE
jgi:putative ABC transport system permease protein